MAQNITLMGASYSAVPAVRLPKTGGGTADFTDVSDTTAAAADVASGKYFYTAAGVKTEGTASGGGGSDVLVVTIDWDDNAEMWVPDCTFAQIEAAHTAGKDIVAKAAYDDAIADGWFIEENGEEEPAFYAYSVDAFVDDFETASYIFDANGITLDGVEHWIQPNFDSRTINITPTAQAQTQTITPRTGYNGLAEVIINVAAGGGGNDRLVTLASLDMGVISTSNTSAVDTGKTITIDDVKDYDLLIVETSRNAVANSRHMATVGVIYLINQTDISTKNSAGILSKWNCKTSSTGVYSTRQGSTSYGIYPNSCTLTTSNGKTSASIPMYQRYNSTSTGQISGSYTARVYGVKLFDLIGG